MFAASGDRSKTKKEKNKRINLSIIRQKRETQNGGNEKTKHTKFSE